MHGIIICRDPGPGTTAESPTELAAMVIEHAHIDWPGPEHSARVVLLILDMLAGYVVAVDPADPTGAALLVASRNTGVALGHERN